MLRIVDLSKWQGQFAYLGNCQVTGHSERKKKGKSGSNSYESQNLSGRKLFNPIFLGLYLIIKLNATSHLLTQGSQLLS